MVGFSLWWVLGVDELVDPLQLALAGLEPEPGELAGVAQFGGAGAAGGVALALAPLLEDAAAPLEEADPGRPGGAVEEGQVHAEAVVTERGGAGPGGHPGQGGPGAAGGAVPLASLAGGCGGPCGGLRGGVRDDVSLLLETAQRGI